MFRWIKYVLTLFLCMLLLGPAWLLATGQVRLDGDWRNADHSSSRLAPDPIVTQEAIVQVYAARAFTWRGLWGIHMWIAAKPTRAEQYTVYQNIGWLAWRGLPVVSVREDIPDRLWYSQRPWVVAELHGEAAAHAIEKIAQASAAYPYQNNYSIWPGPNSNTYIAYIARRVPELNFIMPATAIGKDYLIDGKFFAPTPSGTGYQFSLRGLLGITWAKKEGLEINLLTLSLGINPLIPAVNLPGIGWVSWGGNSSSAAPAP